MPEPAPSRWATRLRRPRWTDPRLLVGLVLVALATVAGSRLVASADDMTSVWAVVDPVRAGDPVDADHLVVSQVRIGAGSDEEVYLSAGQSPPQGVFTRDLAAGELVPATAVEDSTEASGAELSLAVEIGDSPSDLAGGDVVDVWAVPEAPAGSTRVDAEQVLEGVPVASVSEPAAALGGTTRQVLLRLTAGDDLGATLSALAGGRVVLVRVGP